MTTVSPPTTNIAARAVGATKIYGEGETEVRALDGVDVEFERGAYTAIMGPSGSGKSTLLHCIAGLDTLTSGQVFLGDIDLSSLSEKQLTQVRRDRIGFIFQTYNLIPTLTAMENITLPTGARRPSTPTRSGSTTSSTSSACATGSSTARRSCPAVSSSASPSPVRWRAGRRSSSPTSRPATSTRTPAPRSSSSCSKWCSELGQTIVMVTHDPTRGGVREPRRLPRRRQDRRRDPRSDRATRSSTRCGSWAE